MHPADRASLAEAAVTVAEYRAAMLAKRAADAGVSVAELLERCEVEARLHRRSGELRYDRRSGWPTLGYRAAAMGRGWTVHNTSGAPWQI